MNMVFTSIERAAGKSAISPRKSWDRAWQRLGLTPPSNGYERVIAAYEQPRRHYRNISTLLEGIEHLNGAMHLAEHAGEVELAIWLARVIFDPRSKLNEQRSADRARKCLTAAGADKALVDHVAELVMVTSHTLPPKGQDQKLLTDIDLAILGASPERFKKYEQQIQAEFEHMPAALYSFKRKTFLSILNRRSTIYQLDYFIGKFEQQARSNLKGAIAGLSREQCPPLLKPRKTAACKNT